MEKKTQSEVDLDHLNKLLQTCNNIDEPNPKARAEMKELIKKGPAFLKLLQIKEDLYTVALKSRVETMFGSDTFKEVIYVKCAQLRENLGYSIANPLERLAIEQIVLSWFNHHKTEMQHADILSRSHSIEVGLYWDKRLASSNRRYMQALELLSKMRKMNLTIQVNNANNQIINNGNNSL